MKYQGVPVAWIGNKLNVAFFDLGNYAKYKLVFFHNLTN